MMTTIYDETTVEMAREAARAINAFMAHWDDGIPEASHHTPFQGATVRDIERLFVASVRKSEQHTTFWQARFEGIGYRCFAIRNGEVRFPQSRSFFDIAEDLHDDGPEIVLEIPENDLSIEEDEEIARIIWQTQRGSEQLEPDQSPR